MENKKDIGKAFKEKLTNLDRSPGAGVWDAINAELKQKRKRKGIPVWLTPTLLSLTILFVSGYFTYGLWKNYIPVIQIDMPEKGTNDNSGSDSQKVLPQDNNKNSNNSNTEPQISESNAGADTKKTDERKILRPNIKGENATLNNDSKKISPGRVANSGGKMPKRNQAKDTLNNKYKVNDNSLNGGENNADTANSILSATNTTPPDSEHSIKEDSIIIEQQKINTIVLALKDKDNPQNNNDGDYKPLYVFAHIAPSKFYYPDNKSMIDPSLNSNTKTSEINYNYGVYIGYQMDKWGVRAGVIKSGQQITTDAGLQYTYSTQNPDFPDGEIVAPSNYSGIDYKPGVTNEYVFNMLSEDEENAVFTLIQKAEFIEVPLEITYQIYDKKLSLGAIAGFSTLYLQDNSVTAKNESGSVLLGSVKDISEISFTINGGIRVSYKILPNLQINAEPLFKYYINTYKNSNPFTLSLQAGLQYNFNLKK